MNYKKKQLERCSRGRDTKGTGIAHYEYRAMPMPLVSRLRLHRSKQLILHGANYRISRCRDSKTVEDELQTQQTTNYRINRRRSTELADGELQNQQMANYRISRRQITESVDVGIQKQKMTRFRSTDSGLHTQQMTNYMISRWQDL